MALRPKIASAAGSNTAVDVYEFVARIVTELTGVQLGSKQRSMVESRLQKRFSLLGISNPADYVAYFHKHRDAETQSLVTLLTTHHTYFFREFSQFEFLSETALANVIAAVRARGQKTIRVWSAACSFGQEVYSLAMYLDYHLKQRAPDLTFEIVGTDVDPEAVKVAANGVYRYAEIKEAPLQYVAGHWVRGTGDIKDFVKVKSLLREKCRFHVANLVALKPQGAEQAFDIIFCRNVFIYFTQEQVRLIASELMGRMRKGGYLFVGISEGLHGLDLGIKTVSSSVYQEVASAPAVKPAPSVSVATAAPPPKPAVVPSADRRKTLRVICVDDSPSVLMVLKKLLAKERGFEVVGTAANGIEARELLKKTACDVMTLDIHMPEMNGVEYLKDNYSKSHPPVIMVTSVSRDDSDLATKALSYGASDYIEKPSLSNMKEVGEELCTKLRTAFKTRDQGPSGLSSADIEFRREIKVSKPEKCLRIIQVRLADLPRLKGLIGQCRADKSPLILLVSGYNDSMIDHVWSQVFAPGDMRTKVDVTKPMAAQLVPGACLIMDPSFAKTRLGDFMRGKTVSVIAMGEINLKTHQELCDLKPQQLIVEEVPENVSLILPAFGDRVPVASLAFNSIEFFSRVT